MDFAEAYHDRCSSIGHAARTGDEGLLTRLMQKGSSVDVKDNRGWTPLHEAAAHGHLRCVQLLLPHLEVEDINCRSFEGETPLWLAAKKGHHEIIQTLVGGGGDPNICNNEEGSPLLQAVSGNHQQCIDTLLQHGANIRCQFCNGWSLIHEMACKGNATLTRHLLDAGAPVDLPDDFGIQPVFTAAQYGSVECLKLILERGGDANAQAFDKATPLYLAAQEDYPQCIEVLLNHGANPNLETEDGLKPLHAAAHKGHVRCVRRLYPHTTIPLQTGPYTPLNFACAQGHTHVIKYLLEAGCDVNTGLKIEDLQAKQDCNDMDEEHMIPEAPLLDAIENNYIETVKFLLDNGAKTECGEMFCPLKTAFPIKPMLRILIEHGCSPNCGHVSKDPELLCDNQDLKAVKFLLHCGMELDFGCLYQSDGCCLGVLISRSYNTDFMATLVELAAEFTDNLHLCCHLMTKLEDTSHWDKIRHLLGNPPSLQHLSRITIRRLLGPQRLLYPENIAELPITQVTKDYLSYKDLRL